MSDDYDRTTGEVSPSGLSHRWSAPANEIFAALAKAQAEIKNAIKDAQNPHFRSRYADLASVKEACWAALTANGIAPVQMPVNIGQNIGVVTLLGHSSGQWIESTIYVQPTKFDAQGVGSVVTYLRRYALAAMAGVAPDDDDDDGEAAVGRPVQNIPAAASRGRTAPEARTVAPSAPNGQASADESARERWKEIAAAIPQLMTLPELENLPKSPSWVECHKLIVEASGEAAATEAMEDLRRRIGRQSGLLKMQADETAPLPI
jgi:hypothetical protein